MHLNKRRDAVISAKAAVKLALLHCPPQNTTIWPKFESTKFVRRARKVKIRAAAKQRRGSRDSSLAKHNGANYDETCLVAVSKVALCNCLALLVFMTLELNL
jgi:hypothetical protein